MADIQPLTLSKNIQDLKSYGIIKQFAEGETIIQENASMKSIPFVTKGTIRVMRSDEIGKEILLYYITAGESCIMSLYGSLNRDTYKIRAIAEEPTEMLFVPSEKLTALIKSHPEWLEYVLSLYHKRFDELLEVVSEIAFKKMDERLLSFIKKKCTITQNHSINITHEAIASELGTARVVVSRLLKQLEDEGFLSLGRNKITLLKSDLTSSM